MQRHPGEQLSSATSSLIPGIGYQVRGLIGHDRLHLPEAGYGSCAASGVRKLTSAGHDHAGLA